MPTQPTHLALQHRATVHVFPTAQALGEAAAQGVAATIRALRATQPVVRIVFAAAPSQAAMLHSLARAEDLDWSQVEAFHMDEYIGLAVDAPQRFGNWLKRNFFDHVAVGKLHLIELNAGPEAESQAASAARSYAALLEERPIDIVCLGIGMNGHLAFNDPPADFAETQDVRVVALDAGSRIQQVNEGLFATLDEVPTHALTLSIPCLLRAKRLFCCVSGTMKREAVTRAFTGDISPISPASILREHAGCSVFLDEEAAAGLHAAER